MGFGSFLKLVEIQTKVASVIPLLIGTLYSVYRFGKFDLTNFLIMTVSLLSVDMAITAINNYMDYKKAKKKKGYGYEEHNAIVRDGLDENIVKVVIGLLLFIASALGILLYSRTDIVVLLLGLASFLVGIFYSCGPIPISRTALGEVFSGFFMGAIIIFLSSYIHLDKSQIISMDLSLTKFALSLNIFELFGFFLISLPAFAGISNIMLANNICDVKDDFENKRYTLPVHIGVENSIKLFEGIYLLGYLGVIAGVGFGFDSVISILMLATIKPVMENCKLFAKNPTKKDTFILAVKNFVLINSIHILTLGIGSIFGK